MALLVDGSGSVALLPPDPTAPKIVRDRRTLKEAAKAVKKAPAVVIDLECSALDCRQGEIVGLGIAVDSAPYYVPINHREEQGHALRPDQLSLAEAVKILGLECLPLVAHNAKKEKGDILLFGQLTECIGG